MHGKGWQYPGHPELINDPEAFAKFQSAQGELSSALSRLLVVAEDFGNSNPTPIFANYRRNWKVPKTVSLLRVTAISRPFR